MGYYGGLQLYFGERGKWGGDDKADWELADFRNFVENNGLIDIGYVGYPYTWNNRQSGRENIRERLNRVLVNPRWRVDFESGFLKYLSPGGSDHCPILLHHMEVFPMKSRRFVFDSRRTSKP